MFRSIAILPQFSPFIKVGIERMMKADNNDASIFFSANETQHLDDTKKKMESSERSGKETKESWSKDEISNEQNGG